MKTITEPETIIQQIEGLPIPKLGIGESHYVRLVITPDIARHLLSDCDFHGQRKTSEKRVKFYAQQMATGLWRSGDGLVKIGLIGKSEQPYLIAGKHRMSAVVESDCSIPFAVEFYRYATLADLEADYASTNAGLNLTRGQAMEAMGTGVSLRVTKRMADAAAAGLLLIAGNFTTRRPVGIHTLLRNPVVMHDALTAWATPIYAYEKAIDWASSRERQLWYRGPVVAMGMVTFRFQPEKAEEFWRTVCTNDGLRKGTPEHQLYTYLAHTKLDGKDRGDHLLDFNKKIAQCWSAFYEGRELHILQGHKSNAGTSVIIKGTPWNGKPIDTAPLLGFDKPLPHAQESAQ